MEACINVSSSTDSGVTPLGYGSITDGTVCDFNGTALVDRPSAVEEVVKSCRIWLNNIACD
jgi:hypothetical protein